MMTTTETFEADTESDRVIAASRRLQCQVPSARVFAEHDPAAIAWRGECRQCRLYRILTCRAAAVPRRCSMLSVYMAVRVRPFPKLPPLDPDIARVEREGIAAFDAVPLEGPAPTFAPP
jgi:hypothetical protein